MLTPRDESVIQFAIISKGKPRQRVALVALLILCCSSVVYAQHENLTIRIVPGSPGRAIMEGSLTARTTWSFRDSYAGVLGLGARVENFELLDAEGRKIAARRIAPGQFESASPATRVRYEINLAQPTRPSDSALVSWLDAERGLLMAGDLIPVQGQAISSSRLRIRIEVPAGWSTHSSDEQTGPNEFEVKDADRSAIVVGSNLRSSSRVIAGTRFMLISDGPWAFSDDDAINTTAKIVKVHSDVVGPIPCKQSALFLLPLSSRMAADRWSAQTRGCTVSLLMGKLPTRVGALAQFGNALTHETFHLWVPNGIALSGDYDWFYEGFTIYQAARTAVRLDLVTFAEFLNAMARAYDGSRRTDPDRLSLIEASKRRFTVGESSVYSKAMVVAFLYDLNLRKQTKGARSLDDVYRKLARSYLSDKISEGIPSQSDGNAAVVAALREQPVAAGFVQRIVNEPWTIELQNELAPFGLQVETIGLRTRIFVANNLTGRQRDLLRQLGYNDRVR